MISKSAVPLVYAFDPRAFFYTMILFVVGAAYYFFYSRHHLAASSAEEEFEMLAKARADLEEDFRKATI
jgi:ethanolamine permease